MSPGVRAVAFALACLAVVGLAWYTGHKAAIDPGGYRDDVRKGWNWGDKFRHAVGCLVTVLIGFYGFGWGLEEVYWPDWMWTCVFIGFGAWLLIEVAQKFPRSKAAGRFAIEDVAADAVGALAALAIIVTVSG